MAQKTQLIYTDQPGSLAAQYPLPPNLDLTLQSIVARIDGSGAAGSFYPVISVYSSDGRLMYRVRTDTLFNAGDTGVVTWSPFLSTRRPPVAANTQAGFETYALSLGPWYFFPMQEASGNPQDHSGHGFHMTAVHGGAVTYSVQGPYADGKAMRFPVTTYFDGPDAGGFPVGFGETWISWVRVTALPAGGGGYAQYHYTPISLNTHDPNKWTAVRQGVAFMADSLAGVGLNSWTYIALVHRAATNDFDLYVNGAFDSTIGNGGIPGSGALPVALGTFASGAFTCDLCNCAFWARELTDEEIANLKVA